MKENDTRGQALGEPVWLLGLGFRGRVHLVVSPGGQIEDSTGNSHQSLSQVPTYSGTAVI